MAWGSDMTAASALERARVFYSARAWADAVADFAAADSQAPLEPEDLELFATATYLVGRDADSTDLWFRAHLHRNRGEVGRPWLRRVLAGLRPGAAW